MILCADADIRLGAQQKVVVAALVENTLKNHKVQLPRLELRQQVRGVVHGKIQLVIRHFQIAPDFRNENVVADGFRCPDAKQRLRLFCKQARKLGVIVLQADRVALQNLALRRLAELALVIGKELHAVLRFKRLNLLGDGWLRQMQRIRRAAVIHRAAQGKKG